MRLRSSRWLFAVVAAGLFIGCGKSQSSESVGPTRTVDPATAGSIVGTVTYNGPVPILPPIDMSASPACVQANPSPVRPPGILVGDGGTLANVAVFVKEGIGNYTFDAPTTPAILSQKNCLYEPHVMALMTNQPFEIENDDPTMHNVHPMPKHNRQWSNSQPAGSAALKSVFSRPEFAMPVLCNIHPWMRAFVFVFDHPYYAITPKSGVFTLSNLPPGTYTIEAWHESLGTLDQVVTIGPRESKVVAFTFKSNAASGN